MSPRGTTTKRSPADARLEVPFRPRDQTFLDEKFVLFEATSNHTMLCALSIVPSLWQPDEPPIGRAGTKR